MRAKDIADGVRGCAGGGRGVEGNVSVCHHITLEGPKPFHVSLDTYKAALDEQQEQ